MFGANSSFLCTDTNLAALLMSGEKPLSMHSHLAASTVPSIINLILSSVKFPRHRFCPVIEPGVFFGEQMVY